MSGAAGGGKKPGRKGSRRKSSVKKQNPDLLCNSDDHVAKVRKLLAQREEDFDIQYDASPVRERIESD